MLGVLLEIHMLNMARRAQVKFVIVFAIAVTVLSLVSARPRLTIIPSENPLLAPTGTTLGLMCGGSADEEGDFTSMKWFNHDGEEIPENSPSVKKLGTKLKLTVNEPRVEDSGTYKCTALFSNTVTVEAAIKIDFHAVPGQITQIVFDQVTSTTIKFRLLGPRDNGGTPITYYIIRYKTADESHDKMIVVEWPKDTPYVLRNLNPGAKYQFSVAARNDVGDGPWKTEEYIMPEETMLEPPLIKTKQETVSEYPDRFEVHWDPNDNGSRIRKYSILYFEVERRLDNWAKIDITKEFAVGSDILTYNITGLTPDSFYKIEIRASNRIGYSLPATVVIKTSKDDTSSVKSIQAVKITTNSVLFDIVTSGSADSIEVKFSEKKTFRQNGDKETEYQAKWKQGDVYEIKDLIPSGRYSFQFRTIPLDGIWSKRYEVTLLPDPPEVILQRLEGNCVTMMWVQTLYDGVTVDKYQLTYSMFQLFQSRKFIPSECTITIELPKCAGNSYTICNLRSKAYYEIQLRAHTASGYGEPYKQKLYIQ